MFFFHHWLVNRKMANKVTNENTLDFIMLVDRLVLKKTFPKKKIMKKKMNILKYLNICHLFNKRFKRTSYTYLPVALAVYTIAITISTKRTTTVTIITIFIYRGHSRIITLTASNGTK